MLLAIIRYCSDDNDPKSNRRQHVIEKIMNYYSTLKNDAETSLVLGGIRPRQGSIDSRMVGTVLDFQLARQLDLANESLPPTQSTKKR
ncbi:unnamed protein product [Didymodactylos carnosus]|nr:unnamed protein product [Didymodactylos carnosus]CAF4354557.1 unnamed protein product [Didymodactylos carnosus]